MEKYPVRKYEGLEIDREALINELIRIGFGDYPANALADCIISTMPTWLKRSEDNGR